MTETSAALALPDETTFKTDIEAINQFQKVARSQLIEGQDYGVIPGTSKPTLLKPGAEKIAKLLGLADEYEIIDEGKDWGAGFFHFTVKCRLSQFATGKTVSEGLGECNSMEARYRWRWAWPRDVPDDQRAGLVTREVKGGGKQYRLPNEDIYSQVNTLLKMARKRALVDAALSAGRLSQVFTQDIEDMSKEALGNSDTAPAEAEEPTKVERMCPIHNVPFFKKGRMKNYAHKIEGTDDWCNEPEERPAPTAVKPTPPPASKATNIHIDMDILRENVEEWPDALAWLRQKYNVTGEKVSEVIKLLTKEQQEEFSREAEDRRQETDRDV